MDSRDAELLAGLRAEKAPAMSFWPHVPEPRQRQFLDLPDVEALYGGAAGGGKTDALLLGAAQYVDRPGYSALLLRRTFADLMLPGAIMDRAHSWWGGRPDIHWSGIDKRFTFPSGATITFGYLDTDRDRFRYQSAEFQFIGFDELTQFPKHWYVYLLSRLRRGAGSTVPLRVRSATNPGGAGQAWVFDRFVNPETRTAAFVPARMEDNPHLDQESYRISLARLDPTTRRQLEDGAWIRDGQGLVYSGYSPDRNRCSELPMAMAHAPWRYILGLDFGIVDPNALSVIAWRAHDPIAYVTAAYSLPGDVRTLADEVIEIGRAFKFERIVGDEGGMGKAFAEELRARRKIPIVAAEKTNKIGFIQLLNADLASGRVKLVKDMTADLADEWSGLAWAENGKRESDAAPNHVADATLYAWRAACAYLAEPEAKKPRTMADWYEQQDRLAAEREAEMAMRPNSEWDRVEQEWRDA